MWPEFDLYRSYRRFHCDGRSVVFTGFMFIARCERSSDCESLSFEKLSNLLVSLMLFFRQPEMESFTSFVFDFSTFKLDFIAALLKD